MTLILTNFVFDKVHCAVTIENQIVNIRRIKLSIGDDFLSFLFLLIF